MKERTELSGSPGVDDLVARVMAEIEEVIRQLHVPVERRHSAIDAREIETTEAEPVGRAA